MRLADEAQEGPLDVRLDDALDLLHGNASGAVGRQWVSSDLDYTTWNLGAAYQLTPNLALDVRYHDTDQHGFGDGYGARAAATLKAAF